MKNMQIIKILIISIFFSIFLNGCTKPEVCILGDDFSDNNNIIESNPSPNEYIADNKQVATNHDLVRWKDTGLLTNGEEIILQVDGQWSAWGSAMETQFINCTINPNKPIVENKTETKECTNFATKKIPGIKQNSLTSRYITLSNPKDEFPCWFKKGMGMYLLFTEPNSKDNPNLSLKTIKHPNASTIHLGDLNPDDSGRIKISTQSSIFTGSGDPKNITKGMKIYTKIYDSYYLDNKGQYKITFNKGIMSNKEMDFFSKIYNWIFNDFFDKIIKNIFNGLINQNTYKNSLYLLLVLYITILAIAFLLGFVKAQIGELTLRSLKFGLVLLMLSPTAWEFFNNNLFPLYMKGVSEIINIAAGNEQNYNPKQPFGFIDQIINIFFSKNFMIRVASLFTINMLTGALWYTMMFMVIIFMLLLFLYCFCVYALGTIMLGFLTLMLPIFIIFTLFNFTRTFFNEWINAIFSNSFKVIMSFIVLLFFASIVENEIKRTIGYKICPAAWLNFNPFSYISGDNSPSSLTIDMGVPGEGNQYKTLQLWNPYYIISTVFGIDARHKFDPEIIEMYAPPLYKEKQWRYKSLPFLDPNTKNRASLAQIRLCQTSNRYEDCHPDLLFPEDKGLSDHNRIKSMMFSSNSYDFIDFGRFFVMIICLIVVWVIGINSIESIAEYIAIGGEGMIMREANLGGAIQGMFARYERFIYEKSQSNNKAIAGIAGVLSTFTSVENFPLRSLIPRRQINKITNKIEDIADSTSKEIIKQSIKGIVLKDKFAESIVDSSLIENFRFFNNDITPDYRSGSSEHSMGEANLAKKYKQNELNMLDFNSIRDQIGGSIDYLDASLDNMIKTSLFNSTNPLEHSLKTIQLGQLIAAQSINNISKQFGYSEIFKQANNNSVSEQFNQLFNETKLFDIDVSKELKINQITQNGLREHLDRVETYYENLREIERLDNKTFEQINNPKPETQNNTIEFGHTNLSHSPETGNNPENSRNYNIPSEIFPTEYTNLTNDFNNSVNSSPQNFTNNDTNFITENNHPSNDISLDASYNTTISNEESINNHLNTIDQIYQNTNSPDNSTNTSSNINNNQFNLDNQNTENTNSQIKQNSQQSTLNTIPDLEKTRDNSLNTTSTMITPQINKPNTNQPVKKNNNGSNDNKSSIAKNTKSTKKTEIKQSKQKLSSSNTLQYKANQKDIDDEKRKKQQNEELQQKSIRLNEEILNLEHKNNRSSEEQERLNNLKAQLKNNDDVMD